MTILGDGVNFAVNLVEVFAAALEGIIQIILEKFKYFCGILKKRMTLLRGGGRFCCRGS